MLIKNIGSENGVRRTAEAVIFGDESTRRFLPRKLEVTLNTDSELATRKFLTGT